MQIILKMNLYNYQHLNSISVDIIMPNYNKDKFIKYSINSVISQTFSNWNLFIIDDNSNDRTQFEIKYLKKKYKNVTYIFRKKRLGVGYDNKVGLIYSM